MDPLHDKLLATVLYNTAGKTILAVDPGKATGLAWTEFDADSPHPVIRTATISSEECTAYLRELAERAIAWEGWAPVIMAGNQLPGDVKSIVVEEWRLYKANAHDFINSDMPEPRLIGKIEMVAEMLSIPLHKQPAASMKTLPWLEIGDTPHEKAAARHLVRWLIDQCADTGLVKGGE